MSKEKISPLIRIGEWLPDQPDNNNPGSPNINNVICQGDDYIPFKNFNDSSNAVSTGDRVFGAYSIINSGGNVFNFAGDQNELYRLSGSSWVNVSKSSTATNTYNTASDGQWRFTSYGDRVIATNLADDIQSFVTGTSTGFSDLSTAAPKAKDAAVLNNFLVVVHTDDGTIRPNRVQWSALDDPTNWSTAASTLSDYQDLQEAGGFNQRIVTTQNYGVIVRERSLVRMEFIGSPGIFQFTTAEENRGTKALNSVVSDGTYVYYLDENGFFLFDGTRSTPIGNNKVDKYFLNNIDENLLYRIKGAINPVEKYISWAYPVNDNSETLTKLINYHWPENRWSQADVNLDNIETMFTSGLTLEQLSLEYSNIETVPFSFDSRVWSGGKATLAGFSTSHKLGFFEGTNKKAVLESGEAKLNISGRARVSSILPVTDSTGITARVKSRKNQNSSLTNSSSATYNTATNEIPFNVDNVYHRVEMCIAENSTWDIIQGFHFRYRDSGAR